MCICVLAFLFLSLCLLFLYCDAFSVFLSLNLSSIILALHEDALCLFLLVCFHCKYHTEIKHLEHRTLLAKFALPILNSFSYCFGCC